MDEIVKIATWNVNSIRARLTHLIQFLRKESPDVFCLQELKCIDEQFPSSEIADAGYRATVFGQKGYNGVAILSRVAPSEVTRNLGDRDPQSRVLAARIDGVRIVCLYAPNGQEVESPAYQYKLGWYARLEAVLHAYRGEALVVGGDFNIAPADRDIYDPELFRGQTLASDKERGALRSLCQSNQLRDILREQHPDADGLFTWWDYRAQAFKKNYGLRIDHLLAGPKIRCTGARVAKEIRALEVPSDHAPVVASFEFDD